MTNSPVRLHSMHSPLCYSPPWHFLPGGYIHLSAPFHKWVRLSLLLAILCYAYIFPTSSLHILHGFFFYFKEEKILSTGPCFVPANTHRTATESQIIPNWKGASRISCLIPSPGSIQDHPTFKPYVWEHCPDASWAPAAWGHANCPGKPVPCPVTFWYTIQTPLISRPFLTVLWKIGYRTYNLLLKLPEDKTLSPVGAGKYLLALCTCGLMMMHGYSHSSAQTCRWKQL